MCCDGCSCEVGVRLFVVAFFFLSALLVVVVVGVVQRMRG